MEPIVGKLQGHLDKGVRADLQLLDFRLPKLLKRPTFQDNVGRQDGGAPFGGIDGALEAGVQFPV